MPQQRPQRGDVLVERIEQFTPSFLVSRIPGTPQVTFRTYKEAAWMAEAIARIDDVDAWYNAGGAPFETIAQGRARRQ
jgi:hypothetical protein